MSKQDKASSMCKNNIVYNQNELVLSYINYNELAQVSEEKTA